MVKTILNCLLRPRCMGAPLYRLSVAGLLTLLLMLGILPSLAQAVPETASEPSLFLYSRWLMGVDSIAFAPDSMTIATTGHEGILLWDAHTGAYYKTLSRANGPLLAYSPNGQTIAVSYDREAQVQLLDAHTGAVKWTVSTFELSPQPDPPLISLTCLVFSPDGKTLGTVTNGVARLWDVPTGKMKTWEGKSKEKAGTIAFSPDGKTFALGEGGLSPTRWTPTADSCYFPRQAARFCQQFCQEQLVANSALELYDAHSSKFLRRIATVTGDISDLHFVSEGKELAYIASDYGTPGSQNPRQGFTTLEVRETSGVLRWRKPDYRGLVVSSDGAAIAAIKWGEMVSLLSARTGRAVGAITQSDFFGTLAFSPDGQTLASGGSLNHYAAPMCLRLWNTRTGLLKANLRETVGYAGEQIWTALVADGHHLLAEDTEGRIDTWSLQTGALHSSQISQAYILRSLFSADGTTALEESHSLLNAIPPKAGRNTLRLRDCRTGRILKRFYTDQERLEALAWSGDGAWIATAQETPSQTGRYVPNPDIWIWDARKSRRLFRLTPPTPDIEALFFTHDNGKLVSLSHEYGIYSNKMDVIEIAVWNLHTHRLLYTIPQKKTDTLLGVTSENRLMIAHTDEAGKCTVVQLCDVDTGKIAHEWTIPAQMQWEAVTYETDRLALSPDGKTLSMFANSISRKWPLVQNTVAVFYESATGRKLCALPKEDGYAMELFLNGRLAISTNHHDIHILDAQQGKRLFTLCTLPPVGSWIVYTPDNDYDGSPDVKRYVNWMRNDLPYSSDLLTAQHYRQGLLRSIGTLP